MESKMTALTWHGKHDIRCETVPDPKIEHSRDAIIKVTACAICGSDLHIFDGMIPSMETGDTHLCDWRHDWSPGLPTNFALPSWFLRIGTVLRASAARRLRSARIGTVDPDTS
jgi:hypothetical protein